MFSLLTALAGCGPLTVAFLLKGPDRLARTLGHIGRPMFAFAHPYSPQATYELLTDYGQTGRRATIALHVFFATI
jgi:hypothetical protein